MYLPRNASKTRLKEAQKARKNRAEIVKAFSLGQVTRRELVKWGLITAGGLLAPINGLSPFAKSAFGEIPTGAPPSPIDPGLEFTQPMPRLERFERNPVSSLNPGVSRERPEANTTLQPVPPELGGGLGPIEGRPPGPDWAHQRWEEFYPQVAVETSQMPATINTGPFNPGYRPTFHRTLPDQRPEKLWTFDGCFPPKLLIGRYGEPILFRHYNDLPLDPARNGEIGRAHV